MNTFKTEDGTSLFYKDWGTGQPIVFSHGWLLSSDAWDAQMLFLGQQGYRVIAHDRRGHGRSEQTWGGNHMDTYADDLAGLLDYLDVRDAVLVGHSTGGGEVARYLGRHGSARIAKVVLISAVPHIMLKSAINPKGTPIEVLDGIRAGLASNRAQFYRDFAIPFFGYNREGAKISAGVQDSFWMQGMLGGIKAQYDCIEQFSETDFHEDLAKIDVPTVVLQGDDDQIVPLEDSGALTARLVKGALLKVYPGFPHGMPVTHAEPINKDLLAFIQTGKVDGTTRKPHSRGRSSTPRPQRPDTWTANDMDTAVALRCSVLRRTMAEGAPSSARLEAFSDEVVAVIHHHHGAGDQGTACRRQRGFTPSRAGTGHLSTLLAFTGIYWLNHQHLVRRTEQAGHAMQCANLGFLFCLSLLPLSTAYVVDKALSGFAVAVYAASLLIVALSFMGLRMTVHGHLNRQNALDSRDRKGLRNHLISLALYAGSIAAALYYPKMVLVFIAVLTFFWALPNLSLHQAKQCG